MRLQRVRIGRGVCTMLSRHLSILYSLKQSQEGPLEVGYRLQILMLWLCPTWKGSLVDERDSSSFWCSGPNLDHVADFRWEEGRRFLSW